MANVNKVELNLSRKIVNPFKTTRKSTTNPFKFNDFEGNTLDVAICADVFEGTKGVNKLKMISSSVIGSVTKIRKSITEPIVNFANRVKDVITGAWDYAKNTNVEIAGLKNISESIHNAGKGISESISGIRQSIYDSMPPLLHKDIADIGRDILASCSSLISIHNHEKISSAMPVESLEALWKKEISLMAEQETKKIALSSDKSMKAQVA